MLLDVDLDLETKTELSLKYDSCINYIGSCDEIQDNIYKYLIALDEDPFNLFDDKEWYNESRRTARKYYLKQLPYSLKELVDDLEPLLELYGDYKVLDIDYKGVRLDKDGMISFNDYYSYYENEEDDWNLHFIDNSFTGFWKWLKKQPEAFGDIRIERFNCELVKE